MKFKNELEEKVYEIAKRVCGDEVSIEHNKVLQIESALYSELASFSGPPKKEIDLITAQVKGSRKIKLLISCKEFQGYKAQPAHIQEWSAVLHTMNKYSDGTKYVGMVVSPSGFTSGCEAWATSYNIGLVPPLKGRIIPFNYETSLQIFERVLKALVKRLEFPHDEMLTAPNFYNFVFRLSADFESYEEVVSIGKRYIISGSNWVSNFGQLVSTLIGKKIIDVISTTDFVGLIFEQGLFFSFNGNQIIYGDQKDLSINNPTIPCCKKNIKLEECSFDYIKESIIDKQITSAADFGTYFEFGLDNKINLGLRKDSLYVIKLDNELD